MLFTEPQFFLFFALVLPLAWWLPRRRHRHALLLVASYVFYAAWDVRFLALIWISTLTDFVAGRRMHELGEEDDDRRRHWLLFSLGVNLGILGIFKYLGFFVDSFLELAGSAGLHLPERTFTLVLPVGISFYTFQTLSYTIDVYRRRLEPEDDFLRFALFVAFFPQLVAGPIVRAARFLPQLRDRLSLDGPRARYFLTLFLLGFVKKACIADRVAPMVDEVFASPGLYGPAAAWTAAMLFGVQIYCDFSGYTDMALAVAGLLGYDLERNFDAPYLAGSVAEFWHRWHISLSTWLRDYLYIPLGGNRGTRLFTYRNLMLTMILGGLWHGAAWTFVIWGTLHGAALVAHRAWRDHRPAPESPGWGRQIVSVAATWALVHLAWIFFRAADLEGAVRILRAMVGDAGGRATLPLLAWTALAAVLFEHVLVRGRWLERYVPRIHPWLFPLLYGAATALAVAFLPMRMDPFIYFQF